MKRQHPVSGFSQRIEFQRQHNQEEQKYIAGIIRQGTASLVHPSISGSHQRNSCHIYDNEPQGDVEHASFGKPQVSGKSGKRIKFRLVLGLPEPFQCIFLNVDQTVSDVGYQVTVQPRFFILRTVYALGHDFESVFTVRTLYTVLFQLFLANGAF